MKPALKKQKLQSMSVKPSVGKVVDSNNAKNTEGSEGADSKEGHDSLSSSSISNASESDSDDSISEDDINADEYEVSADDSEVEEDDEEEQDSEASSDEDNDDDEALPTKKKSKKTSDGSESFANAFNAIIGSKLKAYDRKSPILARNKQTLKKLESDKLESKARRLMLNEKKQILNKHRVKDLLPVNNEEGLSKALEKERKLKKVSQRGVVKLFNAVLSTQVRTSSEMEHQTAGQTKKKELMTELSKEKFLDLIQTAGQS